MKVLKYLILITAILFSFNFAVKAEDLNQIYSKQFSLSGAEEIRKNIPKDSKKHLQNMGINCLNLKEICNFDPEKIISEIGKIIKEKVSSPFKAFLPMIAIMLLCVVLQSIYPQEKNKEMTKILNSIGNLSICVSVVSPVSELIRSSALIIKLASNFTLCYVPIMSTIMIASGKAVSAMSYNTLVVFAGQVISRLSENFFIPFVNVTLGISVVSSICPNLKLHSICKNSEKTLKKILEFLSVLFTSILTLNQLVSNSADNLKSNLAKCMFGQCVPIVGGVISDAYDTVQGSLRLLKSGVGVFGISAGLIIFLPILVECLMWIIFLRFSECIAEVLEQKKILFLVKSVSKIVSIIMAILIFCIVILVVSCGITLALGGN